MKEGQPKAERSGDSNSGLRGDGRYVVELWVVEGGGEVGWRGREGVRKAKVSVRVVRCSI